MNIEIARCKLFREQVLNQCVGVTVAMFISSVLFVESTDAANGVIKLRGAVTQASCAAHSPASGERTVRTVQVSPGIRLSVDASNNACSPASIPVTLSYKALATGLPAVGTVTDAKRGIVTMTYE